MEDFRKLLSDDEARTSPTRLAWTLRNLCYALQDILLDGPASNPDELDRAFSRMTAIADAALLHANALTGWLDRHETECDGTD